MIRLFVFLAIVFGLGLGFAWLADRPGVLTIDFQGMEYQVTLLVAAIAVVALVAALMIVWWVLKSIWTSPRTVSRYFRARKRDRGYQSLSTGMIAAGAGDAETARRMSKQAIKNLSADQEPLIHLLDAQTLLLEGDTDGARRKFEAMLDDPETRLLGMRGLYLEAQRLREPEAARHYAEMAAQEAPQLGWASNAALEARAGASDWDSALRLIDQQASTRQVTKEIANRRRAVILTAKAIETLDADPTGARNAATLAVKQAPELAPASIVLAKALVRLNDLRKAAKTLETVWQRDPHPDVAAAYVHLRPGDSTADRLGRAERLQQLRPNHRESAMAIARAAFDAGEFTRARKALDGVIRMDPRESAYLLLADVEQEETGDQGRVRHWMGQAVRAPRDPMWTADGYVSPNWAPFSPVTGRIDAFEWRVPMERLGPVLDAANDDVPVFPPAEAEAADVPVIEARTVEAGDVEEAASVDHAQARIEAAEASVAEARAESGEASTQDDERAPEKAVVLDAVASRKSASSSMTDAVAAGSFIPDDPGVKDDAASAGSTRRFRLF